MDKGNYKQRVLYESPKAVMFRLDNSLSFLRIDFSLDANEGNKANLLSDNLDNAFTGDEWSYGGDIIDG